MNSLLSTVRPSSVFFLPSISWGTLFPSKTANVATLRMIPKRVETLSLFSNLAFSTQLECRTGTSDSAYTQ